MKSAFFVSGAFLISISFLAAQNPGDDAKRRLSNRNTKGNTGSFVTPKQPAQKTIVSYVNYVSENREWTDIKGRKMTGRLVAFSAPEPGKTGPIVVVKEGKVRLRRAGVSGSSDLLLEQLSQGDQLFVKAIDAGFKKRAAAMMTKKPGN